MAAGRIQRSCRAAAALALLLLAGCSSMGGSSMGGSPSATPTASAPVAPAFHLAFLYAGAASSSVNDVRASLVALSPRDGSILWSHPLAAAGATRISPAYRFTPFEQSGVVYVGTAYDTTTATGLGAIEALDAASGAVRWRRDVAGDLAGTPAVGGGSVYLTASRQAPGGQGQGFAEALDIRDGAVRWQVPLDGNPGPPVAATGRAYVFLNRQYPGGGTLLALNAADGSIAWRYDDPAPLIGGEDTDTAPTVIGDTLFAEAEERDAGGGANIALLAFDPGTGARRWRYKTGGLAPLPAVAGDVACVSTFIPANTPSGGASVVAGLDIASGRERWRLTPSVIASACVPAGDTFAVAEDDRAHDTGDVVALAAGDGHEVWRRQVGHPLIAAGAVPPAAADGALLAFVARPAAASGQPTGATLLALRLTDGSVLWQVAAPAHQEQPPDVEGDVIYVPDELTLGAYALRDGSLLWRQTLVRS